MAEHNNMTSAYCSYIKDVYQKLHKEQKMSQEAFGKKVIRFDTEKKDKAIALKRYTRNSVRNWIAGENCPEYKESLVCIALLDYCGNTDSAPSLTEKERNLRLSYVNDMMWKYLGKSLYHRNLRETALYHVARGIISIEDIPQFTKEVLEERRRIPADEMKDIALQNVTERFLLKNSEAKSPEEAKKLLLEHQDYYALGYKTLGYRIQNSWEKRHPEIAFKHAVLIHAPRFQNTYRKMMDDNLQVTRDFIIHFCVQMGMNKEEINYALKTAKMEQLEAEPGGPDYYEEFRDMTIAKKMGWLVYLASYLEYCNDEEYSSMKMLPVYSYLSHYIMLDSTERLYKEMENILCKDPFAFIKKIRTGSSPWIQDMEQYIHTTCMELETFKERELNYYKEQYHSFQKLYQPAAKKTAKLPQKMYQSVSKLYLLAVFSYMMFLGREFQGELTEQDMTELEEMILKDDSFREEDRESIFFFFNNLWVIYLDAGELLTDAKGSLYAMTGNPQMKTAAFQWMDGLEALIECWALSLGIEM